MSDHDDEDTPAPAAIRPVRASGVAMAAKAAPQRAHLIDRLSFETLAPAREERPALRLVE